MLADRIPGFVLASTCVQEYCFLKVRAKYFSIEIKTIFQASSSYIPQYRNIQKCFLWNKVETLMPIGSKSNTTHL